MGVGSRSRRDEGAASHDVPRLRPPGLGDVQRPVPGRSGREPTVLQSSGSSSTAPGSFRMGSQDEMMVQKEQARDFGPLLCVPPPPRLMASKEAPPHRAPAAQVSDPKSEPAASLHGRHGPDGATLPVAFGEPASLCHLQHQFPGSPSGAGRGARRGRLQAEPTLLVRKDEQPTCREGPSGAPRPLGPLHPRHGPRGRVRPSCLCFPGTQGNHGSAACGQETEPDARATPDAHTAPQPTVAAESTGT